MTSNSINLSTGPVNVSKEVCNAFCEAAISHRSEAFRTLMKSTTDILCEMFSVKEAFILSGSGTLANEAMLSQIKQHSGRGLILSNGEFGNRLSQQALRIGLDFDTYTCDWGHSFDLDQIESIIQQKQSAWLLFCHCETSTGTMNDLGKLAAICKSRGCLCFVDCMSTVGTMRMDLSNVSMATASSGKGLAAFPGLAIIFSNIELMEDVTSSIYLSLYYNKQKQHIPFTISSNPVKALYASLMQKKEENQMALIDDYSKAYFDILQSYRLLPFGNSSSRVFTLVFPNSVNHDFLEATSSRNIILSHESEYLRKRSWIQLATLGYYEKEQLDNALEAFNYILPRMNRYGL